MTRTPVVATMLVAGAAILYWGIGTIDGSRKLASLEPLPPRAHYAVTLAFPPERFHQMRLQDQGRVVEVRERTVFIMDVTPASIRDVAREYWVDSIAAWAGK
jgi:hypothetical protein